MSKASAHQFQWDRNRREQHRHAYVTQFHQENPLQVGSVVKLRNAKFLKGLCIVVGVRNTVIDVVHADNAAARPVQWNLFRNGMQMVDVKTKPEEGFSHPFCVKLPNHLKGFTPAFREYVVDKAADIDRKRDATTGVEYFKTESLTALRVKFIQLANEGKIGGKANPPPSLPTVPIEKPPSSGRFKSSHRTWSDL